MRSLLALWLAMGCTGQTTDAALPEGSTRATNRLALESSPYLLQHATNPVDWRPWGAEAFADARTLDRPVLLSIGYSTCHWCHVMEEESFEDEEIAAFLNANFVAIKVDREERPDVDAVYLRAVQALTGRGGWPMTLVLTPEGVPVFAGTYFPPRKGVRGAREGLLEVLQELARRWRDDRANLALHAEDVSRRMELLARPPVPQGLPGPEVLDAALARFDGSFDARFGGFGRPPKFPEPAELRWLLAESRRSGDPRAREMALATLDAILAGGVRDQVGGGFHRYAVDERWQVPHFEKMLYDQAQLTLVLVDAWQLTGEARYASAARDTADFMLRELRDPDGGFRSATDADSADPEGARVEGWFYTWTPEELRSALGDRAELAMPWYSVTTEGHLEGRSVMTARRSVAELAAAAGRDEAEVAAELKAIRLDLYRARASRPAPFLDDKIVLGWNALVVSALARAGFAFDQPLYLEAARGAARFTNRQMVNPAGDLARSWRAGRLGPPSVLEDQALHVLAMLDLFEATGEADWLHLAIGSAEQLERRFGDPGGGWWETAHDAERLLTRGKPWADNATPSGNGAATLAMERLYALTGEARWRDRADAALMLFANNLDKQGSSAPTLLLALDHRLGRVHQVVLTPGEGHGAMLAVLQQTPGGDRVQVPLLVTDDPRLATVAWVSGKVDRDGLATAYVCHEGVCEAPTTDPATFRAQLAQNR